ncbi:MAG: hypothetical protein ACLQVJ_24225 [Syntrophobacteraceae bacterium]
MSDNIYYVNLANHRQDLHNIGGIIAFSDKADTGFQVLIGRRRSTPGSSLQEALRYIIGFILRAPDNAAFRALWFSIGRTL